MNEIERLTAGISASLSYDYCCMRGNLFGESYLASSIGEILQSLHGGKSAQVISGYQHPILANVMLGSGRRPELDFVVTSYDDSSLTSRARSATLPVKQARNSNLLVSAIETKWAGSSHCTPKNVIWDLLRLEMIAAENPKVNAILLIAGRREKMISLRAELENFIPFNSGSHKLDLLPSETKKRKFLRGIFIERSLQTLNFPKSLQIAACVSSLSGVNASGMSVIAWRVKSVQKREKFRPFEIAHYKI